MTNEVVEPIGFVIVHFPQAYHIEPGNLFITQFVPPFPPNCFAESGLCVSTQGWCSERCPVPNPFEGVVSRLCRSAYFILRFGIDQQRFSEADLGYVQVILPGASNTRCSVGRPVEVFEHIRRTERKLSPIPVGIIRCVEIPRLIFSP